MSAGVKHYGNCTTCGKRCFRVIEPEDMRCRACTEPRRLPPEVRFMNRIEFDTNGGCWLWRGAVTNEYGQFDMVYAKLRVSAHRAAYQLFVGPIPEGALILHSCDVPLCVNPAHLRPGTTYENAQDMVRRGHVHRALDNDGRRRISDNPQMTTKRLARQLGVAPRTVRYWRKKMESLHVQ